MGGNKGVWLVCEHEYFQTIAKMSLLRQLRNNENYDIHPSSYPNEYKINVHDVGHICFILN